MKTLVLAALCLTHAAAMAHAQRIELVAGGGASDADGVAATMARLKEPFGVEFDPAGNLIYVEMAQGQRVRKVDAKTGLASTIAGTGEKGSGGDGRPAKQAQFDGIHNLAIAPNGDIYLADTWNCKVRKIDAKTGIITSIAGTGEKGFSGDGGPATQAKLGGIYCVSIDPKGERLLLSDLHNLRVRAVDLKTGVITTIAGNGQKGVPQDGALAVDAPLFDPRAAVMDRQGNLYILERGGNALRVVDREGKVRTVVNASGKKGATGDGDDALQATLNGPKHLCVDAEDNVIIADAENHLIRKYLAREGKIVRVAGTGVKGDGGLGGSPLKVELNRPHGVTIGPDGLLYITDTYNHRIARIIQ